LPGLSLKSGCHGTLAGIKLKIESRDVTAEIPYPPAKERRRIVFCALETYSKIGGLQNFNRRVIRNLAKRALERQEPPPRVLLLRDQSASIPSLGGIEIRGIGGRASFMTGTAWTAVTTANLFVLGHVNLLPLAVLVRCLRPKLPILLFVHGDEVWNDPRISHEKRWFEPWFLRVVTKIASVSAYTAETMGREFHVRPAKFSLLPNAVDPLKSLPDANIREEATILTVTRLETGDREKNVGQMIRAVAKLKHTIPGLKYEIAGDGALRPELETLASDLGVSDCVKFLGLITDAELDAAYARATVFALPSSKEGFGIVYLEAWQRGLPVVCASKGAPKEIVADGVDGFVVDPGDVSMLADKLNLLLSRPELAAAMGESGRRKVEAKYLDNGVPAKSRRAH
jgi:phosphatidylinositol alpha-1,6-mannosyltransferase